LKTAGPDLWQLES